MSKFLAWRRRKIETPRGLKWSAMTVIRVQRRLGLE